MKEYRNAKKGRSKEFQEIHSGNPERAFWDDFPWRMRAAKADMLGTGDLYLYIYIYTYILHPCNLHTVESLNNVGRYEMSDVMCPSHTHTHVPRPRKWHLSDPKLAIQGESERPKSPEPEITRKLLKVTQNGPPTNLLGKHPKITKHASKFESKMQFLVIFELFSRSFGGGPLWVTIRNFRVISGSGDLGLSHWRPELQPRATLVGSRAFGTSNS